MLPSSNMKGCVVMSSAATAASYDIHIIPMDAVEEIRTN